jgi:hypothetical protein
MIMKPAFLCVVLKAVKNALNRRRMRIKEIRENNMNHNVITMFNYIINK